MYFFSYINVAKKTIQKILFMKIEDGQLKFNNKQKMYFQPPNEMNTDRSPPVARLVVGACLRLSIQYYLKRIQRLFVFSMITPLLYSNYLIKLPVEITSSDLNFSEIRAMSFSKSLYSDCIYYLSRFCSTICSLWFSAKNPQNTARNNMRNSQK